MECSWKGQDEDGVLVEKDGTGRGWSACGKDGTGWEWSARGKGKEKICTLMAVICKIITIFAGYLNDGQ